MLLRKKLIILTFSLTIIITNICSTADARSVYVIADTVDSNLAAYKIQGTGLTYQTNYLCEEDPGAGIGAVGLAIDAASGLLLVTFEEKNVIELVNAKTMEYKKPLHKTGNYNIIVSALTI